MTQPNSKARLNSKSVPSTGMRGGLGRTLLTAFLLLSIVPLSLISYVASTQAQHNLQQELKEKLVIIAALTESQIKNWVSSQQLVLTLLADDLAYPSTDSNPSSLSAGPTGRQPPESVEKQLLEFDQERPTGQYWGSQLYKKGTEIQAKESAFMALFLLDPQGQILAAHPPISENRSFAALLQDQQMLLEANNTILQTWASDSDWGNHPALVLTQPVSESNLTLVAFLNPEHLIQAASAPTFREKSGEIYLVPPSGSALKFWPTTTDTEKGHIAEPHSTAIEAALAGQSDDGCYENYQGIKVIGAYRWLPELNMALMVEQPLDLALASSDNLAVVLIGAALAVALLTALIAAAVTRRITLPIVELTATAVQIAAGDLDQKVPATRRDEIGILARAFNVMTAKLQVLYENLEQKVRERTQQLREASAEANYRAMQLGISAEIARVVTSILDHDRLLPRVVDLIRDCFQAYFVAIFFVDEDKEWAILREGSGWLGDKLKTDGYRIDLGQDNPISRAVKHLRSNAYTGDSLDQNIDTDLFPHTRAELVVPLIIGKRPIGVLDVHSAHEDAFVGDEIAVLETLTGQIAVAIENARIYEMERQAAEQLRELEELRSRFLTNMSRELRMPLNNIIGFSRVIMKGIDGPITDLQYQDLNAIHESGQQLLALINDILDIAQIEAGAMELSIRPVDLGEIAHSVTPTVNALLQGRPIKFDYEISSDLPPVLADPDRLRQVLVKLLSNAANFTHEGEIKLRVWPFDKQVIASVSDTGIGIPDKDRQKIFEMFRQLSQPVQPNAGGAGLGLTFSKEIIEMHGGSIWVESKEGKGTTFTIALPILESTNSNQLFTGITPPLAAPANAASQAAQRGGTGGGR